MKIAFTGTQQGMTEFQKKELAARLTELNPTEFIHGDCIGADNEANTIAMQVGVKVFHLFPSTLGPKRAYCFTPPGPLGSNAWWTYNTGQVIKIETPEAPLYRNKKIVDECDMLIACPKEHAHTLRSGTWATIRYAWKRKKNVLVIPPIVREDTDDV